MTRRTNFDPRWARRGESLVVVADGGRARILIAAPRFLGVLRGALSAPLRQMVTREIARDLTAALPQPIARAAFSLPVSSTPAAASPG